MNCKICGSSCHPAMYFDFNKNCQMIEMPASWDVYYWQCNSCEFLFTKDLDNVDFKEVIYNDEYIKFDPDFELIRPWGTAEYVRSNYSRDMTILDYGGGTGKLSKLLRSQGYKCWSYDPFFGDAAPKKKFDMVISIEAMEHSPDPKAFIADMLQYSNNLLVSTLAFERSEDLWYVSPRNGHISIFTPKTLKLLGFKSLSKNLHTYVSN